MATAQTVDTELLERFEKEIWSKIPHLENDKNDTVVGATPLIDITNDLRECAKNTYKTELDANLKIMGKLDSKLLTGSIKVRPAVHIIHDAIKNGNLRSDQAVIEATSGNFGIALGLLARLGLKVIALVSRRLQEGVFEELRNEKVHIIDLDMDVCPAPGMKGNKDEIAAKVASSNIRLQLLNLGFAPEPFDNNIQDILELLQAQDIINLAKLLAKIYNSFCPAQYDNMLNPEAHRTITAVEIDQQLAESSDSLDKYQIVCTFGTGGTSSGFNKYMTAKYDKNAVHVVFPPAGQDVAGIRTKATADGLAMYKPGSYAGEHVIDFEKARPLHRFFVKQKGYDMGESSALATYAAMKMSQNNQAQKFIVIIADGISKYRKAMDSAAKMTGRIQVSLEDAAQSIDQYDKIVWVHPQYTPQQEGIEVIARSLGVSTDKIAIQKASTIEQLLTTQKVPDELSQSLQGGEKGKCLLICMAGNTSLMTTKILAGNGITTESLNGGITGLPESMMKSPGQLVKVATD